MLYLITSKVFTESKYTHTHTHARRCFIRYRSSHPDVFVGKGVLKICSKFTGKHPCRSVILIKLFCNFIETTLRHGSSPVNLLHIFRTIFLKNTAGWLLLKIIVLKSFGKFTGKHLCWSHFFINLQA